MRCGGGEELARMLRARALWRNRDAMAHIPLDANLRGRQAALCSHATEHRVLQQPLLAVCER